MDYEKKYKEALERAKKLTSDMTTLQKIREFIFPELAESEGERIRRKMIEHLKSKTKETWCNMPVKDIIAYLEKQKEPVVDKEGMYYYLGGKFIYCGYPATEENPLTLLQQEKQKEPHYTKRNALFDKCVENCDPKTVEEVNKRVDDIMNMPELSAFEQALTNFIGYWEDDEEHWPSQFVKKHGKHILDMAREELQKEQKEQKPAEPSNDELERTFECNPEKLPQWLKDKLAKKHLEGYIKGQEDAEKRYNESVAYHLPIMPTPPSGWGCDGTHCTNPHMDCINCPRKTTGGTITTPNTCSGTATLKAEGNTSITDGKAHNPSFTD